MTTRTVSTELTPARRQAFEEAVERHGKSFFANADLIWKTLLGAAASFKPKGYIADAIMEAYGERCPDFNRDCHTCRAWAEYDATERFRSASLVVGKWLSAALDDPDVCDEMKADIEAWFNAFGDPLASPKPTDTAEKEVGDGDDEG